MPLAACPPVQYARPNETLLDKPAVAHGEWYQNVFDRAIKKRSTAPRRYSASQSFPFYAVTALHTRERVAGGAFFGDHFVGTRLIFHGAGDRFLGGGVVVFVDLLVVFGFPVDEDAADNH